MAESFGQTQDDLGPENIPLAAGLGRHDALEFALLFRGDLNRNGRWHIPDDATARPFTQPYLRDITLGVLILAVIGNIMNLKNVPGYHQEVVKGIIILVAVLLQSGILTRRQS